MKTKILLLIISTYVFLCFVGCSGLSRGNAKDIILNSLQNEKITLHLNNFGPNRTLSPYLYGNTANDNDLYLNKLISKGYLEQQTRINNFDRQSLPMIVPLSKITPFSYYDYGCLYIIVAKIKDVTITGITGSEDNKIVEFNEFFGLNTLGEDISYSGSLMVHSSRTLQKYDDGWR
jgi:hypothetical protein